MFEMQDPRMLLFLPAVALLGLGYVIQQRRPYRYCVRYSSLMLVKAAVRNSWRRQVPALLFLMGLVVLVLASARPVLTGDLVPHAATTVILVVDVSGSMSAVDVPPTRLDAVRHAIQAFLEHKPPDTRVGVVAFGVSADLVQAPTTEPDLVMRALDRLHADGGTEISAGLEAAHRAVTETLCLGMGSAEAPIPARVVLLSDGASNKTTPYQVAEGLARDGIPVYTVGLGAPGTSIVVAGVTLHVDPDEPTLSRIAQMTGGTYSRGFTEDDLRAVYAGLASRIVWETERMEVTALLTGLGATVILVSQLLTAFR